MLPSGNPTPARPPVVRPLWALASPTLGAMLAAGLLTAPIGPLASAIQRDLGLSTSAVVATLFVPCVVATAAMVVPGYLLGRRWPTATGLPALMLLILGSVVSAFVPGAALMAVGRVIVGLGAGVLVGVALALSGQVGRWRSRAQLVLGLAFGAGVLLGPVASGMLTQALGWRWGILVNVPVAAVVLVITVVSGIALWVHTASRPSPQVAPATTTPFPSETRSGGPAR